MKHAETNSAFSGKYLKWLYLPLMRFLGGNGMIVV